MLASPLKLRFSRWRVDWPLPFAVVQFVSGLCASCGMLAGFLMDRDWLSLIWLILFAAGTLFAALQVAGYIRLIYEARLHEARLAAGRCKYCAYDLTGYQAARCPECGSIFATPTRVALDRVRRAKGEGNA